jgi:hypothetical protein
MFRCRPPGGQAAKGNQLGAGISMREARCIGELHERAVLRLRR